MTIEEYDRTINDNAEMEYIIEYNKKQKLKKNKRKERINKIKEILYGKKIL